MCGEKTAMRRGDGNLLGSSRREGGEDAVDGGFEFEHEGMLNRRAGKSSRFRGGQRT